MRDTTSTSNTRRPHAPFVHDFGFPSPAAADIAVTTPCPDQSIADVSFCPWGIDPLSSGSCVVLAPEPNSVRLDDVPTPVQELQPVLSFDNIVGAHVNPAPNNTQSLLQAKMGSGLCLPSFSKLGIAAPHSESPPQRHPVQDPASRGDLSRALAHPLDFQDGAYPSDQTLDDTLHEQVESTQQAVSPSVHSKVPPLHSPLHHYVTTLTPPDENGRITWESITEVAPGPLDSPSPELSGMATSEAASSELLAEPTNLATGTTDAAAVSASPNANALATELGVHVKSNEAEVPHEHSNCAVTPGAPAWLGPVIQAMLKNLQSVQHTGPIKILSHALPTPSIDGHLFPAIILSLRDQTPSSPMCWINVFHALPGKFNLADLPTSPPSTPGPPIGGDDYFTSKIFDSAVRVLDYQDNLQSLPQSPSPIVPPSSVDVSIVERYIPPTNANEFSEMFNTKGPSILVDRLIELSPDNGTLIFIYPTRKGGRTFMREYLGPLLEPLLRGIVVVNGFSANMGSSAGKMVAIEALPDHDVMRMKIQTLCAALSQSSARMEKFHRKPAAFSLVYSAKEEVRFERKVWADMWWCKQEKPRLREVVNRFFRMANRASEEKTPPMIIQDLLDGIAQNPYRNGEPTEGIEVGVFVIKRSG